MTISTLRLSLLLLSAIASGAHAEPAEQAQRAAHAGSQASQQSTASTLHGLAASGQVTSALTAAPLLSGGAVATAGGQVLLDAASAPIGSPLPLSDEQFTIVSPDQALKPKAP